MSAPVIGDPEGESAPGGVVPVEELWLRWRKEVPATGAEGRGEPVADAEQAHTPAEHSAEAEIDRPRRWWRWPTAGRQRAVAEDEARRVLGALGARWLAEREAKQEPPRGWVVERQAMEAFLRSALPPRHNGATLLRLAGSAAGEERSARAYDRLLHEPLPERVRTELEALCEGHGEELRDGLIVVPSFALRGADDAAAPRQPILTPAGPVHDRNGLFEAIRSTWAACVLPTVLVACARAGARELSMALLLVPASASCAKWLGAQQAAPLKEPVTASEKPTERPREGPGQVAHLTPGFGPDDGLSRLSRSVLLPLFSSAGADLARRYGLRGSEASHAIRARGDHLEIDRKALDECLEGAPRPLARLVVQGIGPATAGSPGRADSVPSSDPQGASASSPSPDSTAAPDVYAEPIGPPDSLRTGHLPESDNEPEPEELASLWSRARRLRGGLAAARAVTHAISWTPWPTQPPLAAIEGRLDVRLGGLAEIELEVIPTDALGTSFGHAREVLDDALRLWLRARSAELSLQAFVLAIVHGRLPRAPVLTGVWITELGRQSAAGELAEKIESAAIHAAGDEATLRALAAGVRSADELPAGAARGDVLQILAGFGDWCARPWELATPRWSEDSSELLALVGAAAHSHRCLTGGAEPLRQRRANALAAGRDELGRLEPALTPWDRSMLRSLLAGVDDLWGRRRSMDRTLLRALALCRRVAVAMDGRLVRLDRRVGLGGAFSSTVREIRTALETQSQELARLLQMRRAERLLLGGQFAATGDEPERALGAGNHRTGVGASPGLHVGRARIVVSGHPPDVEPGDVLIAFHLPASWGGLLQRAGAVVSEVDGCLSSAAQIARAFGVPMVCNVAGATQWLRTGDWVQVDASRGTVQRLPAR